MLTGAGELQEALDSDRSCLGHLRVGRTAAAHRHHDRLQAACLGDASDLSRDRGLARALAGPDDRDRRDMQCGLGDRRIEAEVGSQVRDASRERLRREPQPFPVPEHRLVRKVDDGLGGVAVDRDPQRRDRVGTGHGNGNADVGLGSAAASSPGPPSISAPITS